jgi:hypothetical protein
VCRSELGRGWARSARAGAPGDWAGLTTVTVVVLSGAGARADGGGGAFRCMERIRASASGELHHLRRVSLHASRAGRREQRNAPATSTRAPAPLPRDVGRDDRRKRRPPAGGRRGARRCRRLSPPTSHRAFRAAPRDVTGGQRHRRPGRQHRTEPRLYLSLWAPSRHERAYERSEPAHAQAPTGTRLPSMPAIRDRDAHHPQPRMAPRAPRGAQTQACATSWCSTVSSRSTRKSSSSG